MSGNLTVVHRALGCGQKKLRVSVAVPPAPVRVPSQRSLVPSVASVTSVVNDKGDNEIILGAVQRSPALQPRKTSARRRQMKGLCDQSLPQMGSLSSK